MTEFNPVLARAFLGGGRQDVEPGSLEPVAPYVRRAFDAALRGNIRRAAAGELTALILVYGRAASGKNRSLFEAVRELGDEWTVVRPHNAAAMRHLPVSGLLDRPCVVWLNELQSFLARDGQGLSEGVIRDVYAASSRPVVMVGTLWPDRLRAEADDYADTYYRTPLRETHVLIGHTPWVRRHQIPADPTSGFTQTLAGAQELVDHYAAAPPVARVLLDAAVDARRLGHRGVLPEPLLRALALALWRQRHGPLDPPDAWYEQGLGYALQVVRADGGVRALVPIVGLHTAELLGYEPADILQQHLSSIRRADQVSDVVWDALREHTLDLLDLGESARAANRYGRLRQADAFRRKAAASGDPDALLQLARWSSGDPEVDFRAAAAAGDPWALGELGRWLRGQEGRDADAEALLRAAAAAGDSTAMDHLAAWVRTLPGRADAPEGIWWESSAAGNQHAIANLAGWLKRSGRQGDVEGVYRSSAAAGHPGAQLRLAHWLQSTAGPEADVETAYRAAVAAGETGAMVGLAEWLRVQDGRGTDAELAFRQANATGEPGGVIGLAKLLLACSGREDEAEAVFQEVLTTADPFTLSGFAGWLSSRVGQEAHAAEAFTVLVASGDGRSVANLARSLQALPGQEHRAEAAYRAAAAAGDSGALSDLARWWVQVGRAADAEALLREQAAAGRPWALFALSRVLDERSGREAEVFLRHAVDDGIAGSLHALAEWLGQHPGGEAEAEALYREAAAGSDISALTYLARLLQRQPGREADAEPVLRAALAAGHPDARHDLWKWLYDHAGPDSEELTSFSRYGVDAEGRTDRPGVEPEAAAAAAM